MLKFHLTLKSRNQKTGPIPVSTSSAKTCPPDCPLKSAGCYAEAGPLGMFWRKVTEGAAGVVYSEFLQGVADLPNGLLWRHNQSGDLVPDKKDNRKICGESLRGLVLANKGKRGFTYTHFDPSHDLNWFRIKAANKFGFTVNLSGNNFDHADKLADQNCGPVVTVAPIEYERKTEKTEAGKQWAETIAEYKERIQRLGLQTKAGRKIVICPATYSDDVSCKTCALCQKQRQTIVAFPAHGTSRKKAHAIASLSAQ